ncbi:MAG: hypothetical protein CVU21_04175 [Betaproteobacteria bacterium HGW-Betaproteobacteria-15]|nr:MAG: hypothetical protein CVU21_04175 [Betaproteobacteria bacterium HGW-Betaproteobacteria-15]
MDDLLEHQRRQEEEEFWEDKERNEQRPKGGRKPDFSLPDDDDAIRPAKSAPLTDSVFGAPRASQETEPVFRQPAKRMPETKKKTNMAGLWLVLILVLGALGYQGYRMWQKSRESSGAIVQSGAAPALPPVLGAVELPATVGAPNQAPLPAAAPEPEGPAGPTPEQVALNARLDKLEARLNEVIEGLRAQGYVIGEAGANGGALPPSAFAPRQVAPPVVQKTALPVRKRHAPKPVIKAMPPVTRQELLSVDMWGGKPSVVVGNGDPKNSRIKVLQPGDSFNGITLNSVDVGAQRATFTNGARSITLDVTN